MNDIQIIQNLIYDVRGQRVMFDSDLARLYGVETKQLKRAVKRNIKRFPSDFMFEVTPQELIDLRCQFGTSNLTDLQNGTTSKTHNATSKMGGTRYNAFAFTELGVAMLSSVLKSETAIDINVRIMRAFVELRRLATIVTTDYADLKLQIDDMRAYVEELLSDQNEINEDTQAQLTAINQALAELSAERNTVRQPRRPIIGFSIPNKEEP